MVAENRFIADLTYSESAQCELAADLALVPEVAGRLRAYCFRHGLDRQTWTRLELAFVEGLNNAIEHGCGGEIGARIRVSWNWVGELIEIEIHDPGQYVAPSTEVRLPDPLAEGGRGRFMMSALMDSVSHEMREGVHVLVMRARLGLAVPVPDDQAEATLAAMTGELRDSYETITALFRFAEELATAQSFDDFVEQVLLRLRKLVKSDEAWLRLAEAGESLELVKAREGERAADLPESLAQSGAAVEAQVFRDREEQTVEDCSELAADDPLRRGQGCAIVCPIWFRETTIGVLSVLRAEFSPYFSAAEIRLIGTVADFLGIARAIALAQDQRETRQRTERELEIAAEIQRSLLPTTFPETGAYRFFGISEMASEVGGDYFDVLPIEGRGVLLAIADVMGKGMPAALLATILRTAIRAHRELASEPGRLLTMVNRQLADDLETLGMFITAQVVFLPDGGGGMLFATAGHCPPLKLTPGALAAQLCGGGDVPLGVLREVEYATLHEPIARGGRLILLTDGVYEVPVATGRLLGLEAFAQKAVTLCTGDLRSSCARLLDLGAGAPAFDDRTLLIAERL